jgi:formamidopyrimidine-DNA glycosylase
VNRIPARSYSLPMPELAEVEYFRRCWDSAIGQKVLSVHLRGEKRIFRGNDLQMMERTLSGARLVSSEARGKQLLFGFSNRGWLGIHLGMTGALRREGARFIPGKHDHLVLRQRAQSLVFSDPRQFGRVLFHHGSEPEWWTRLPAALLSPGFTFERMRMFLARYRRTPIKAVLLRQEGFPGIGNWMADEILWRAKLHPAVPTGKLKETQQRLLWRTIQLVCKGALRIVSKDYSDPPPSWLFRHRWKKGGRCPKDQQPLQRTVVGGRTTVSCPECQPKSQERA